jgi:hypothetical protein
MGMTVTLDGYSGFNEREGFNLFVEQSSDFSSYLIEENLSDKKYRVLLDNYLYHLLMLAFRDDTEIIIDIPTDNFDEL